MCLFAVFSFTVQELRETPKKDDSFIIEPVYDVEQVKLTIIHLFSSFLLYVLVNYGIISVAHGGGKSNSQIWEMMENTHHIWENAEKSTENTTIEVEQH
jgi:hypothetical protein